MPLARVCSTIRLSSVESPPSRGGVGGQVCSKVAGISAKISAKAVNCFLIPAYCGELMEVNTYELAHFILDQERTRRADFRVQRADFLERRR